MSLLKLDISQYPVGYKPYCWQKPLSLDVGYKPEPFSCFADLQFVEVVSGRTHMHLVRYHVGSTGSTWR